jgi:hypothetical protein
VAASAAYALAGSAEKLYLPRLAQVGSIGAVMIHIDQSVQDQARGLKYSAVFSGTRKMDGWDHAALSGEARAAFQGRVDHCRDALCDLVRRQGRMSAKDALATEAAVYSDSDAVEARLADGIRTFDEVLASLTQVAQNSQTRMAAVAANTGASAMTTQKDQMLSGASPSAIATAQKPATIEAPAAPEPVASAPVVAAAAAKPKPGETCATCGQVMPNDDDDMPADPNASAPGYTVEMAMETMDLCAIAKVPVSDAKAFVKAKTPIATVRSELARRAADATDALAVDGTAKPAGAAETAVAAAWDSVVQEINSKMPTGARR